MLDVTFRSATPDDALFIAHGFFAAMLLDDAPEADIQTFGSHICGRTDVLYSWRNTTIAMADGQPVGMLTAYEGAHYATMRQITMQLVKEHLGIEFPGMDDEATAGEYYIDSLAVLPPYRGQGIGRALLRQAIAHGASLGLNVTLVVDPANPKAQRLYQSLGFRPLGRLFLFGHDYQKMAIAKP